MAEFVFLGGEVGAGAVGSFGLAGEAFSDGDAGFFELRDFVGIVREEADFVDVEKFEDLGGEAVIASVVGEAKLAIGLDGVEAGVLKFVGFKFVDETDATAFLWEIKKHTVGGGADFFEGVFELGATVAALGGENVAGETLGVDADDGDEGGGGVGSAVNEGDGVFIGAGAFEAEDFEIAEA